MVEAMLLCELLIRKSYQRSNKYWHSLEQRFTKGTYAAKIHTHVANEILIDLLVFQVVIY